jgi:UDP-sugar transporter A1/2/3
MSKHHEDDIESICKESTPAKKASLAASPFRDNLTKTALALVLTAFATLTPILIKVSHEYGNDDYASADVVACAEAVKMILCAGAMMRSSTPCTRLGRKLTRQMASKILALALMYAVHNNAMIETVRIVSLATFQVWFTWRILVTALGMHMVMGKRFTRVQIGALLVLVTGTMLTQWNGQHTQLNISLRGLAMIFVLVCTSSIAAVWNEAMLKNELMGSFSLQNLQLYAFGLFINLGLKCWHRDLKLWAAMLAWSPWTWATVASMSLLGIATSATLKYADNIVRAFAAAWAIIATSLVSWIAFEEKITCFFGLGSSLTCVAIAVYFGSH